MSLEVTVPLTSGMSEDQMAEQVLRSTMEALTTKLLEARKDNEVTMEQSEDSTLGTKEYVFRIVPKT